MKHPSLLHILRSLNPADGGPVEVVRRVTEEHAATGVATEVVTLDAPDDPWLADWPVKVHALAGHGRYGWTSLLVDWLRRNGPGGGAVFVHGLWQWQGAGTWQALRGSATPYFVFPHGMLDPSFRTAQPWRHARKAVYWRLIEQRVIRDAAGILFTCEEERQLGRETFQPWSPKREEIITLGTCAPPASATELRERFFAQFPRLSGRRLLLFLGRLHEKKGCDLLLEAFRKVSPPMHLVFAGPSANPAFEAKLRALSDGLAVTFTGPLFGKDKWAAFAAAEAMILPSHQENFGMVVAEALASSLPVLISDKVNIWREIAEDGAGLVEPDNTAGAARLLERWLAADHDTMRGAAARCFAARFDIRRTAASLARLVETRSDDGL